jgi:hypothetical protein
MSLPVAKYAYSPSDEYLLPIMKSLYDATPQKIRKIEEKRARADISPISTLNELCKLLHLPSPKYSFHNDVENGYYLCDVEIAGYVFESLESKYWKEESKKGVANIALDTLLNVPTQFSCQTSIYEVGLGNRTIVVTPDKSHVNLLTELCREKGWNDPSFSFEKDPVDWKRFYCSILIEAVEGIYTYDGEASFAKKREAKEDAAKNMFTRLIGIGMKR